MRGRFAQGILAVALSGASLQLARSATDSADLQPDAPDSYTVVKGDTLWDISGRFLQKPWRWPEVWELNREQIKNPHLIYPGDVVYLDRNGNQVRLRLGRTMADASGAGTRGDRLSPMVRAESLSGNRQAIPTISAAAIEPFINRPMIVEQNQLQANPRVLAGPDTRVYFSRDDLIYARGLDDERVNDWHIYRPARAIIDPDTRLPIAYEAQYLGQARLIKGGDPATLRVISSTEEIGEGDRMMPASPERIGSLAPRSPDTEMHGKIVSVYRGITQVGRNSVVALNLGSAAGLQNGHVLAIQQTGRVVIDREDKNRGPINLPPVEVGHMLVFRVFDKFAYGLVTNASRPIQVGDSVVTP